MKNLSLRAKLLVLFLAVGVIPSFVIGLISISTSGEALSKQVFSQLESMRSVKKDQISQFFSDVKKDMDVVSEMVRSQRESRASLKDKITEQVHSIVRAEGEAVYKFITGWKGSEKDLLDTIATVEVGKTGYIWMVDYDSVFVLSRHRRMDGVNIAGLKDPNGSYFVQEMVAKARKISGNGVAYHKHPWLNKGETVPRDKIVGLVHIPDRQWVVGLGAYFDELYNEEIETQNLKRDQAQLSDFCEQYGYSDLLLVDAQGLCYFTAKKGADYSTNFVSGKYAASGLGRMVRRVLETKEPGIADIQPYAPDNGDPALFFVQPLVKDGAIDVLVVLKPSVDIINSTMNQRDGMGESGEIYLVGKDGLMRSDSHKDPANYSVKASLQNPTSGTVSTDAFQEAMNGRSGNRIIESYAEDSVLSSYAPLQIGNLTWALIAEISEDEAFATVRNLKYLALTIALICMAVIVGVALLIGRSISNPIVDVSGGLHDGATQVAGASGMVSSSSQALAQGASTQAASIEETSSVLEEMSARIQRNAENAGEADNLMKETTQSVSNANESMSELNHSINDISKASEETSKIIKTIDEIAFQTNLLALNAAVEAARAGDAGAGFAVVADEVRSLAIRAADAAKNTDELIQGTVRKINNGNELVSKTSSAFNRVYESTQKVSALVEEISGATQEQAEGIQQVNKAVGEIDKVIQQNAASAEESASASEEMNAQAESMLEYVERLSRLVTGSGDKRPAGTEEFSRSVPLQPASYVPPVKALSGSRSVAKRQKEVRPEEIIPLDNDFSEF